MAQLQLTRVICERTHGMGFDHHTDCACVGEDPFPSESVSSDRVLRHLKKKRNDADLTNFHQWARLDMRA